MLELLDPAMLLKILPIILLINGVMFGAYKVLEAISKFTKTDADDKAVGVFGKIIAGLQKIVDVIGMNPKN